MFGVTILGNNSALPAFDRHPTAQVVTLNDQALLIDCGEGTQMQIARYKIRRSKINYIFISHLHGDHYFGLIGLLTTMGLLGRENELNLFGPKGLDEIIAIQLKVANTVLPFKLNFTPLEKDGILVNNKKFQVECFATQHRVECYGFIVREKKQPRKIDKEKVLKYEIPTAYYESLKVGKDYERKDGSIVKNEWVTVANSLAKSYAFCADTIYDETIANKVQGVDVIYHETTYLKDLNERAAMRFHSTTVQAASIAKLANTNRLLIGHFSSKYEELDQFLIEAREVFPNTDLAVEGISFRI
ncbi:MAG: ribonuclease Z [Chitinophagaceae bacterium]